MSRSKRASERVLYEARVGDELRKVTNIASDMCVVMELSEGPDTELAYGCVRHGHKVVCEWEACAQALCVGVAQVEEALAELFASGGLVFLSDLMERLDRGNARYAYMAWDVAGDAVLRSSHCGTC